MRDNLPEIKDGAYIINLDECSVIGTHWVALDVQHNVTYFDSFGVEHILKEIKAIMNHWSLNSSTSYRPLSSASQNKNITTNILKYKHMIQLCVDIFALDLLILCLKEKLWLNILIFSHQITLRRMMV